MPRATVGDGGGESGGESLEDFFEGLVLDFGPVKIKIKDVDVDEDSIQVDFKLKVAADLEDETGAALNLLNILVDGPVSGANPLIDFSDETLGTPNTTSDTFRLQFTAGSGLDLIDI